MRAFLVRSVSFIFRFAPRNAAVLLALICFVALAFSLVSFAYSAVFFSFCCLFCFLFALLLVFGFCPRRVPAQRPEPEEAP